MDGIRMRRRLRIGVIFGGQSGEHEVSLASARSVMAVLDPEKYEIIPIGITHSGRWLISGDPMADLGSGGLEAETHAPSRASANHVEPREPNSLAETASRAGGGELVPGATGGAFPKLDVIFPILHGPYGEDGTIQGLLELVGVPYVGCGVLASSLGMDKIASKYLFIAHGLPVSRFQELQRRSWEEDPERVVLDLEAALPGGYPMFVKPANLGSSIGISKAEKRAELREALADAARYDRRLIVEAAVPNAREIECAVLGNEDPIASVPGEVVPCNEFYDYSAKYLDDRSQLLIPAPITAEAAARVRELAVKAFKAIDGAGMARVDFLMNGATGELFLNELNTMPGFTAISMYPKLWAASGVPYAELVDRLVDLAVERRADRRKSLTTYTGALPAG
jgi:D-alanine-D-alanine ligase